LQYWQHQRLEIRNGHLFFSPSTIIDYSARGEFSNLAAQSTPLEVIRADLADQERFLQRCEDNMPKKITGDRLVLALISVVRTLVLELSEKGLMDSEEFVLKLQQLAIAHREAGDPNNLADAIHALSEHLVESTT